jgi:potassium-dependent mechanosensitive channel
LVLITTTSLKEFSAVEQAAKALERARAEDAAWTGFKESPPFSILLLDDLLNERSAVLAKRRTTESALANMESLRANAMSELKAAEDRSNAAIAAVQNAEDGKADAAKWRLDAARAKVRAQAARAGYLETAIEAHKQRVTAVNIELALVDRKIAVVRPEVVFSDEDLAKVEGIANERSKALQKEIAAVSKRLQTAFSARTKAQAALDAILAKPAEEQDPDALDLARFRLEAVEGRVESLQSVNQSLEGLSMMENFVVQAYQDRRTIMQSDDDAERGKLLESLGILAERYRSWLNVISNEIGTCGAELSKIESRAASISPDDPRFELINEQRAARSEKLTMLQRVQQAATSQRTILRRWISEHTPDPEETGLFQKLGNYAANGWDMVKKTWDFEVMSFEDKIEVDGQTITGKLPVTLGMLLRALLFFVIGYAVASAMANRIQRVVTTRGHIAEAQAKTLRNWAMIVVGVGLALGTLSFLKIPLTVFAFFGGALAIGLGFGMQTLIKNFISGIIVLAERKIRVGDILDVDGIIGTVVEVNTRSSIIRSADEVETMIPNSVFLENRVTNWTLSSSRMRRNVRVGVAYGADPRVVMEHPHRMRGPPRTCLQGARAICGFRGFRRQRAGLHTLFLDRARQGHQSHRGGQRSAVDDRKTLAEAGISVPFPQRDIHLISKQPINVRMTDE